MKSQWLLLGLLTLQAAAASEVIGVGEFSRHSLAGWQPHRFKGETRYRLQNADGRTVLHADSQASASGLFKEQVIDLRQTPFLNWSWRVGTPLRGLNEQSKAGDDYAARVYVVVRGGWAFWQTRVINYVWAGSSEQGRIWPNAFAGEQAMMLALRDAHAPLNVWQAEKRNVRDDFKRLFGEDIVTIDAVAIMTDTDSAMVPDIALPPASMPSSGGGQASADYGDLWFSRD